MRNCKRKLIVVCNILKCNREKKQRGLLMSLHNFKHAFTLPGNKNTAKKEKKPNTKPTNQTENIKINT